MPPKRRRKAADILDKVLETASLPHSIDVASLKEQVEEELRVLNVRAPLKQLGKGDSLESRKLVLLQLQLKSKHDVSLITQSLASCVGMKAPAFESLSVKVSRYVGASSTAKVSKKKSQVSTSQQSVNSQSVTTTSAAAAATNNSTILALSIRLGSHVHDSHGFAQRARQLYRDIEQYLHSTSTTMSNVKKRGYLEDMQRSRPAYEAACFYLVARGRKLKKTTSRGDDASLEDDEEETQLTIQNVIDASNNVSASEFRDVLPTVEKFASEIDKERPSEATMSTLKKRPAADSRASTKPKKVGKRSKKQESAATDAAARALLEGVEAAATVVITVSPGPSPVASVTTTPTFVYSPKFLEWKKCVLQEARDRNKRDNDDTEMATEFAATQRVADEVLRRNGILSGEQ